MKHLAKTLPVAVSAAPSPTAGKTPYLMFRFYATKQAFFDKSWSLADIEKIKP